jgi:hypothetical protein
MRWRLTLNALLNKIGMGGDRTLLLLSRWSWA